MDPMPTRNHRRLFARRNGFKLGQSEESLLSRATARNAGTVASGSDRRGIASESKNKRNTNIKRHSKLGRRPDSGKISKRRIPPSGWKDYADSLKPSLSKNNFFFQKQLSIYLYAYSHMNTQLCTPRPLEVLESRRHIDPSPHIDILDYILDFQEILNLIKPPNYHIHDPDGYKMKLDVINTLEEAIVSTISYLHTKHISYPIENTDQLFFVYTRSFRSSTEEATLRVLLGYNKHASWTSDNLSATWRFDEIEHARSLFHLPKILIKLRDSPNKISLDARDQHILIEYLESKRRHRKHFDLCCERIAPMTFELIQCISYYYALRNEGIKARAIFDTFFLKCDDSAVSLPPLSSRCLPLEICAFYRKILRQGRSADGDISDSNVPQYSPILTEVDNTDGDKYKARNTPNRSTTHEEKEDRLEDFKKIPLNNDFLKADSQCLEGEQDEEDSMTTISNKSLARLIYIRAEAAFSRNSDREEVRQWWFLALTLYDAFLSDTPPRTRSEYICAGDAHGYRRIMIENK